MTAAFPPIEVTGLMTEPGEAARYAVPAQLIREHVETTRVGGGGGVSFRVARGVYVRSGAGRSHQERRKVSRVDDTGTLVVTDRRIVFFGSSETLSVALTKVVHLEPFVDGVRVDIENKKPVVFVTSTRATSIVIDRARRGLLGTDLGASMPLPAKES